MALGYEFTLGSLPVIGDGLNSNMEADEEREHGRKVTDVLDSSRGLSTKCAEFQVER